MRACLLLRWVASIDVGLYVEVAAPVYGVDSVSRWIGGLLHPDLIKLGNQIRLKVCEHFLI